MLCQFTPDHSGQLTLAALYPFEPDVYPIGRLDADSEGLLLLTNDRKLTHRLLHPKFQHRRTYWTQVEGNVNNKALDNLRDGVPINIKGNIHHTLPATVRQLLPPPELPPRIPPIRHRLSVPTAWIEISLIEGKNRQVRRMTAAVGLPTLRLVRYAIEDLTIDNFLPYEVKSIKGKELYELLKIK